MRYLRSVKSNRVSQNFGENRACIYSNRVVVSKVNGICPNGSKDLYKSVGLIAHNGVDRATWFREPVHFPAEFSGWVKTEVDRAGGIGVDVVSKERILKCNELNCDEIHYIKYRAWHHWEIVNGVWDKKQVNWGALLAFSNSSGLSGGNHVHDILKWCNKYGDGIHKNNGYYGAFDPTKHPDIEIIDEFIIDYLKKQADLKVIELQIKEVQLTLVQILTKYIFILQEQIRSLTKSIGSIFQGR